MQVKSRGTSIHELTDGRNEDAQSGTKARQRMAKATIFMLVLGLLAG